MYQHTSVIIPSNKGFDEWTEFLGDPTSTRPSWNDSSICKQKKRPLASNILNQRR